MRMTSARFALKLPAKSVDGRRDDGWPSRPPASARRRPLAQLVHLEVRERRIQRRIHELPDARSTPSPEAQPELDRDAVLQVFDCSFVTEAANVVYVGGLDPAS